MEHIHPRLVEALRPDNNFWEKGDRDILAVTSSGSVYTIRANGGISGGKLGKDRFALLSGAVYRHGGPIRVGKVVIGLSIEARMPDEGKFLVTTPVEAIYYLGEKSC